MIPISTRHVAFPGRYLNGFDRDAQLAQFTPIWASWPGTSATVKSRTWYWPRRIFFSSAGNKNRTTITSKVGQGRPPVIPGAYGHANTGHRPQAGSRRQAANGSAFPHDGTSPKKTDTADNLGSHPGRVAAGKTGNGHQGNQCSSDTHQDMGYEIRPDACFFPARAR